MTNEELFAIKDFCRGNLNRYTLRAYSCVPQIDRPLILDAGCGTGVPALALAEKCNGIIYAVDSDPDSIRFFKQKVVERGLDDRVKIFQDSIFNRDLFGHRFDIVIAEGLLNATGFRKGLSFLEMHASEGGYIIIHDELKDEPGKREIFEEFNLELTGSFRLDENVWRDDYFRCLEKKLKSAAPDRLVRKELEEVNRCRTNPEENRSVYYILRKRVSI